jgi:hypothetical protein
VLYDISSNIDQQYRDNEAYLATLAYGGCAYVVSLAWQCRKQFPSCTVDEDGLVDEGARVCKYSCYQLRTYDDNICAGFSDEYFAAECEDTTYFGNPPDCEPFSFYSGFEDVWWSLMIIGFSLLMGLFLGIAFFRRWTANRDAELQALLSAPVAPLEERPDSIPLQTQRRAAARREERDEDLERAMALSLASMPVVMGSQVIPARLVGQQESAMSTNVEVGGSTRPPEAPADSFEPPAPTPTFTGEL